MTAMRTATRVQTDVKEGSPSLRYPETFAKDVISGLSERPRTIPPRWFYDLTGSQLFEAITALPEYYPTRTERLLIAAHASEIAEATGPGRVVVEFGSGSSTKTPILLSAISPSAYVPIDISGDFLRQSSAELSRNFPDIPVYPLEADFTRSVKLPKGLEAAPALGFFPGSTIGNLTPYAAVDLLRTMADNLQGSMLLIGIDRVKAPSILLPAYDDMQGVTARFNLNLLNRINRELHGTICVGDFVHQARWNVEESRIEMHLVASRDTSFVVGERHFDVPAGETIQTESSYKYAPREAHLLLRAGGWSPVKEWTDAEGLFSIYLAAEGASPSLPSPKRPAVSEPVRVF
jgi:L-histidine Nalpha-methyltransferase